MVGDSAQAIYGWREARDVMTGFNGSTAPNRLVAGAAAAPTQTVHCCGSDGRDRDGSWGVLSAGRARRRGPRGPGHLRLLASHPAGS